MIQFIVYTFDVVFPTLGTTINRSKFRAATLFTVGFIGTHFKIKVKVKVKVNK